MPLEVLGSRAAGGPPLTATDPSPHPWFQSSHPLRERSGRLPRKPWARVPIPPLTDGGPSRGDFNLDAPWSVHPSVERALARRRGSGPAKRSAWRWPLQTWVPSLRSPPRCSSEALNSEDGVALSWHSASCLVCENGAPRGPGAEGSEGTGRISFLLRGDDILAG